MKNGFLKVFFLLAAVTALTPSCSKDDKPSDPPPAQEGKAMKLTITATGLRADDHITLTVAGGTISGTEKTLYKLNNVTQENLPGFSVDKAKLLAGPVVIESVVPLFVTDISLGGFSAAGHTYSIKIEPVIDGKAQTAINQAFTTQASSKTYRFQ